MIRTPVLAVAALAIVLVGAPATAAAMQGSPLTRTTPGWQDMLRHLRGGAERPDDGGSGTLLRDVAPVSDDSVWSVGERDAANKVSVLTQHWDGASWTAGAALSVGRHSMFFGVDAMSDSDVWAVGGVEGRDADQGLIEHWDGSAWSVVPVPDASGAVLLTGVGAVSPTNAWAVGVAESSRGVLSALILHWNGERWQVAQSPRPKGIQSLFDTVSVTSADDVWASGYRTERSTGEVRSLLEHWDGTSWHVLPARSPGHFSNELFASRSFGDGKAWAGGSSANSSRQEPRLLVEHVDGSGAWDTVRPPADLKLGEIQDVTGSSPSDVWLVGLGWSPSLEAVSMHWNGRRLANVTDQGPGQTSALLAADSLAPDNVWAVGYFSDGDGTPLHALHQQWNGHEWVTR